MGRAVNCSPIVYSSMDSIIWGGGGGGGGCYCLLCSCMAIRAYCEAEEVGPNITNNRK